MTVTSSARALGTSPGAPGGAWMPGASAAAAAAGATPPAQRSAGSFGGAASSSWAGLRRALADAATMLLPGALERAEARLKPGEGAVLQAPLWRPAMAAVSASPSGGSGSGTCPSANNSNSSNPLKRVLLAGKVASWRDPQTGAVVRHSALCTHMGCALSWNALDGSFDCGCHGSVFDGKGRVCSGPAVADLEDLRQ